MVEFPTANAKRSAQFFEAAFGWRFESYGNSYTDVQLDGGSSLGFQADATEAPSTPLAVVEVDDLEASLNDVIEAGGEVTVEPFDFPGGRRFHFREPGGNVLAVWAQCR